MPAGGQHIAALVNALDAVAEPFPSSQDGIGKGRQTPVSAAASLFTMVKACLVCQDAELQSAAGQLLLLFGVSCTEVCERLLDFDICEYTCEGLRFCSSAREQAFTSLRPFALNGLELLHVMAACPGQHSNKEFGLYFACKEDAAHTLIIL
jgi:hypothetical protein